MQVLIFRHMEGQDLRQTLVTIGLSIVLADLLLWIFGGEIYTFDPPAWIYGSTALPLVDEVPDLPARWCCSRRSSSASACGCCSTARASA